MKKKKEKVCYLLYYYYIINAIIIINSIIIIVIILNIVISNYRYWNITIILSLLSYYPILFYQFDQYSISSLVCKWNSGYIHHYIMQLNLDIRRYYPYWTQCVKEDLSTTSSIVILRSPTVILCILKVIPPTIYTFIAPTTGHSIYYLIRPNYLI